MFLKSFRGFSSFDFITLVTSVTAVAAISGPIVSRNINSERILLADREMKKQAFEIAQKTSHIHDQSRKIASVDTAAPAGLDPWGQPYQVNIIKNSYGLPTHVVIWSMGPNHKLDTPDIN